MSLSTAVSILWAVWGTLEAFHEGWWLPTLGGRLLQTLAYLTPMLIVLGLSLLAIRWPRFGAVVYLLTGVAFSVLIAGEHWGNLDWGMILSWLPVTGLLIVIGVCYWLARLPNRRLADWLAVGLPLLTCLACAVEPAWRVAHRIDDGERGPRLVAGNGVELVWAPAGPGWVTGAKHCANWDAAVDICTHLNADGTALLDSPQNIWRLPTVDEAVRSQARHGRNCGGVWDPVARQAHYTMRPDKESPLWVTYAETIYRWTATEDGPDRAFMIVYDGKVWPRPKKQRMGSLGFRAVREP